MPIKTLGSLEKIRVGCETGNTHIFLGPYGYCLGSTISSWSDQEVWSDLLYLAKNLLS